MENTDLLDIFRGWAEVKRRGSGKRWVLLIEEKSSNKVIKVDLTDVFSQCLE